MQGCRLGVLGRKAVAPLLCAMGDLAPHHLFSIEEKNFVKRILTTLGLAATFCTATVGTVLANKYPPHPPRTKCGFHGCEPSTAHIPIPAIRRVEQSLPTVIPLHAPTGRREVAQ